MVNVIRFFFRRLFRLGVDVKGVSVIVPTDLQRLEVQELADKRQLYESTMRLLQYATGLFPHEIQRLSNSDLTTLVDRVTRKMREADEKRWGK